MTTFPRSLLLMIVLLVLQQQQNSISAASSSCLPRERDALRYFKRYAFDPYSHPAATQSWLSSSTADPPHDDCCTWFGVTCDAQGMVTRIDVNGCDSFDDTVELSAQLNAEALRALAAIHRISTLDFSCHGVGGSIAAEIGNLTSLTQLVLRGNNMSGPLPASMGHLKSLEELDLGYNQFDGTIPPFLQNLTWLSILDLSRNNFSGAIPHELANLELLDTLVLSNNHLDGQLPPSMHRLTSLRELNLGHNLLSGLLPPYIANFTSLEYLDLSNNQFSLQPIPASLLQLPSLVRLDLSSNKFRGAIPDTFTNATRIHTLDLSQNQVDGPLPLSMRYLTNLTYLNISYNQFPPQAIPSTLISLPSLFALDVSFNDFTAIDLEDCSSFNAESQLQYLNLAYNKLTDGIFESASIFQHLTKLIVLDLSYNQLQGLSFSLSSSVVVNPELLSLMMSNNRLQGPIPQFIRHLTKLEVMDLGWNELSGGVPEWIGSRISQDLRVLILAGNQLTGAIPASLGLLSAMQKNHSNDLKNYTIDQYFKSVEMNHSDIRSYQNNLNSDVGIFITFRGQNSVLQLQFLTALDLSQNHLSGPIPADLGSLQGLVSLNLSGNQLDGEIPATLGNLTNLLSLDLSSNELQGHIPDSFNGLNHLEVVNVSRNHLMGRIPSSPQWDTFNVSSFLDNDGLCTSNANSEEGLPTCASPPSPRPSPFISGDASVEGIVEWGGFELGYPLGFLLGILYFWAFGGGHGARQVRSQL